MDLSLLWKISYGMYTVGVNDGKKVTGCIVNTVSQITSENPVFSISLNKDNYTAKVLMKTGKLCVSVLSENFPQEHIGYLGFQSGETRDKFKDVPYFEVSGMPVPKQGICGYFTADLIGSFEMDTHIVVFVKLIDAVTTSDEIPMTYKYYHEVIKGKAPKNAPTYQEKDSSSQTDEKEKYICTVCGYVHEGPMPEDFRCPICAVGKDKFKKL